jgi:hypothetical protein
MEGQNLLDGCLGNRKNTNSATAKRIRAHHGVLAELYIHKCTLGCLRPQKEEARL